MACNSACSAWEWETDPSLFDSSQWCGAAGFRKPTTAENSVSGHGNCADMERQHSFPSQRKPRIAAVGHDSVDTDAIVSRESPRRPSTSSSSGLGHAQTLPLISSPCNQEGGRPFAKLEDGAPNGREFEGSYENQRASKLAKAGFLDLSRTNHGGSDGKEEDSHVGGLKGDPGNVSVCHGDVKIEENSATPRHSGSSADSLTGLQLGKRAYVQACGEDACAKATHRSKKSRSGARTPRCQVQGCDLDLTSAKEYHRRHKVCEAHSKAVRVVVASLEQRFCQQCSRFHLLTEFDDAKRSCRRRLAGHNERRRKPQPDPLAIQTRLSPLEGWSYLHPENFPRASLFLGCGDFRWSRQGDQLNYDYKMQLPMAMERPTYTRGLPLLSNDALPPRSPRALMPNGINPHPQIAATSMISNSLTLATTASMPLADQGDAFPGFGMTPLTCSMERIPEYGRALSLLSLQTRSSPAPQTVPPEPWGLSDMVTANQQQQHSSEPIAPQHWLLQAQDHQQSHAFSVENMIQYMASKAQQVQGNAAGYEEEGALVSPPSVHAYETRLQGSSKHGNLESTINNKSMLTTMPYLWNDSSSSDRAA